MRSRGGTVDQSQSSAGIVGGDQQARRKTDTRLTPSEGGQVVKTKKRMEKPSQYAREAIENDKEVVDNSRWNEYDEVFEEEEGDCTGGASPKKEG